jgi:hypothetical protein
MRVRLSDLSCVALVCGSDHGGVKRLTALCTAGNGCRLGKHTFYPLSCIYHLRYESWAGWFSSLWLQVNEIEAATSMMGESWKSQAIPSERLKELENANFVLEYMDSTQILLYHGEDVASFANKLGKFCLDALNALETPRSRQGHPATSRRDRSGLEEMIRATVARCDVMQDRLSEMKRRLQEQTNVVGLFVYSSQQTGERQLTRDQLFSLITHRDIKLAKQDNETMKPMAAPRLEFLPATLITVCFRLTRLCYCMPADG